MSPLKLGTKPMACRLPFLLKLLFVIAITGGVCLAQELSPLVSQLRQEYQAIETVHLVADTLSVTGEDNTTTNASDVRKDTYEFWGAAEKYRINMRNRVNRATGPGLDYDVAYDGSRFQAFDMDTFHLSYSKKRNDILPMTFENPLLYPLMFLSRPDPEKIAARLPWSIRDDDSLWDRAARDGRIVQQAEGKIIAEFPAGEEQGRPCVFRVEFAGPKAFLPTRITRESPASNAVAVFDIEYQEITTGSRTSWLPKRVHFRLSKEQTTKMKADTTIHTLEVGVPLPSDIFTLDAMRAEVIWDADVQAFIKSEGGYRPAAPALEAPFAKVAPSSAPVALGASSQPVRVAPPRPSAATEDSSSSILSHSPRSRVLWPTLILFLGALFMLAISLVRRWRGPTNTQP